MAREIKNSTIEINSTTTANDFKDRLVKLIPSEIITAYVTIFGLIKAADIETSISSTIQWSVFGVLLILTPLYLNKIALVKKIGQIIFTTIAFVIWVFVVGGPFSSLISNEQLTALVGSILLILYTLLIPFVYKG